MVITMDRMPLPGVPYCEIKPVTDATHHPRSEIVLFGAFDRHNFGDILFPHVSARMLPGRRIRFAGLRECDLRPYGGHFVESISALASAPIDQPFDIVHAGGELLTCDAWEAAVMLASAEQVAPRINEYPAWTQKPAQWAQRQFGLSSRAPYVLSHTQCPRARKVIFNAVGGVDLEHLDPFMFAEVMQALRHADFATVRDAYTQRTLNDAGIDARLLPDPAVMVAALFGDVIRDHTGAEAVSAISDACPNGYFAVQFSADFGDDRTLEAIAGQLDSAAAEHDVGIAFFRAGIAPWHDSLEVLERTRQFMRTPSVHIMTSPNVWDICALISGSRAYCGSSLHGRVVAAAFALPRINIRHPARLTTQSKHTAFASTWEGPDLPDEVRIGQIKPGVDRALQAEHGTLQRIASELVSEYQAGFERVAALLP
jgi:hypothetical protein